MKALVFCQNDGNNVGVERHQPQLSRNCALSGKHTYNSTNTLECYYSTAIETGHIAINHDM